MNIQKIGDYVDTVCLVPSPDGLKRCKTAGLLVVECAETEHRAILWHGWKVLMCHWDAAVEVIPDDTLDRRTRASIDSWRERYRQETETRLEQSIYRWRAMDEIGIADAKMTTCFFHVIGGVIQPPPGWLPSFMKMWTYRNIEELTAAIADNPSMAESFTKLA